MNEAPSGKCRTVGVPARTRRYRVNRSRRVCVFRLHGPLRRRYAVHGLRARSARARGGAQRRKGRQVHTVAPARRAVYLEQCESLSAALKRERQLKLWSRTKKEALITAIGRLSSARSPHLTRDRRFRPSWRSSCSLLPLPFRLLQPLRHLLVVIAVARPTDCVTVPPVILDGHVNAAVDDELHRLVRVRQEDEMEQDARRLV